MKTGPSDLHIHRLFSREPSDRPDLLQGLDLSSFRGHDLAPRPEDAGAVTASEVFFQEAVRAIRNRALTIPSPFGGADLTTSDVLVSPCEPWKSVPLFAFRFVTSETFYFLKRGHSSCYDVGLFFPGRSLLVSFAPNKGRVAQDSADLQHAFRFFAEHSDRVAGTLIPESPSTTPCLMVNSYHFAHHLWNELSVIEGLISEGLHKEVLLLVNRKPLAEMSELFPEIPQDLILNMAGSLEEPSVFAMKHAMFVAPAGRRRIPRRLISRLLDCAAARFPDERARSAAFRAQHELVLWVTVRLDARTATNLVAVLAASISSLLRHYPRTGVIFDGFTLPSPEQPGAHQGLTDRETRTVAEIVALVKTPFDYAVLSGKYVMEAFLWAQNADFYVCPYGTAQHKVWWINPVPGIVHVGENKRPVAEHDPAYHALEHGVRPSFFYGTVTRSDLVANDHRTDLFSYDLDVDAFVTTVEAAVLAHRKPRC